ncbi:RES domain-containing protein [Mesorhizobium waimense]|uniref:RES domain-containing protein n=1 Tax=Mesorhizobium waimense TaxID=1300307 RepID=A0A3A5JYQ6_9HYPH|nr:RES family NAD+ phosphorylase [Mesorhizobium waimense]RJT28146.1 RES domain-containing protein [Mesorhizobium waimense]
MTRKTTPRDSRLIDALEVFPHTPLVTTAWRVVRDGRDVTQCSASGGRWDDCTFDVLYTSLARDGAIAEMYFHLLRGQPVFPSKAQFRLYELTVSLSEVLRLPTLPELAALGLDTSRYGQLSYAERMLEYPRTQEVAEVAHFMDFDALMVPSARWPASNLVIFCDRLAADSLEVVQDHGLIDWWVWQRANKVAL